MELVELQCNSILKEWSDGVSSLYVGFKPLAM